ncbi:MAG TPA: phage portal protein [Aurantimonas coralicida]|uniref:Phage portal protein n=2 Tax=root TaxID=1 RepID=A0A9C9NKB9_9HYPH|nr:phage portal protein [Aurantimonas coralicida]HEU02619.1 phage portal protein [Aurantimonas coralicida]
MPAMFGFLRKSVPVEKKEGISSPSDWLLSLFGAMPAAAGVSVTPQTAMRCTPVRAAVQTIAESIGQLPFHVYRRGPDRSKERDSEHPVAKLLNGEANEWTASSDFQEQLTRDALLWGNGYGFINRIEGRPQELLRLQPDTVSVDADETTGEPRYKITSGFDVGRQIARRDILHIKAPSLNGIVGDSPVVQAKEAIASILAMEEHCARLFGNGARPSGVIEMPNNLSEEGLKRMRTGWEAVHGGAHKSGKTALLWDGAKFVPLTFSSVDAQFLELRRFAIDEIARVFRVPPHMLFEMGRATWGNAEEMGATFVTYTLQRWLRAWQGEVRLKLFAEDERDTFFAEFLVDDLLRADISARAVAYSSLISSRVLNPNEVRAMENRPPYEGGEAFANPNITTTVAEPAQ